MYNLARPEFASHLGLTKKHFIYVKIIVNTIVGHMSAKTAKSAKFFI